MAKFSIHEFDQFVNDAWGLISALYKEIEEVQEALNDAREVARLQRRDAVERARGLVRERRAALDSTFLSAWDGKVTEQKHSLEAEAEALREVIQDGESKSVKLLADGRTVRDELRGLNPQLNEQEEALKRDIGSLTQKAQDLDRQLAQAARFFGVILQRSRLKRLEQELRQTEASMAETAGALERVRDKWRQSRGEADGSESGLETEWTTNETRLARLRQDLASITADLDGEAERRALYAMVAGELSPPPTGDAEIDGILAEVNRISDTIIDEEERALTVGAEMLGVLSGMGQGMEGFAKSVRTVRDEKDAHSELAELQLDIPDDVPALVESWRKLSGYVSSEKQMAAYPRSFVEAVRPLVDETLTPEGIERLFTEMGNALSSATERWNA